MHFYCILLPPKVSCNFQQLWVILVSVFWTDMLNMRTLYLGIGIHACFFGILGRNWDVTISAIGRILFYFCWQSMMLSNLSQSHLFHVTRCTWLSSCIKIVRVEIELERYAMGLLENSQSPPFFIPLASHFLGLFAAGKEGYPVLLSLRWQ